MYHVVPNVPHPKKNRNRNRLKSNIFIYIQMNFKDVKGQQGHLLTILAPFLCPSHPTSSHCLFKHRPPVVSSSQITFGTCACSRDWTSHSVCDTLSNSIHRTERERVEINRWFREKEQKGEKKWRWQKGEGLYGLQAVLSDSHV